MRDASLFSLLVSCALLAACSGTSGSSVSTSQTSPALDLTGHWSGRTTTSTGFTGTFTADLVQDGTSVRGSMRAPGGCIGGGKVDGTMAGDRVDALVTAGDVTVSLSLTVSADDQLDGTFDLPASGACAAQRGSVSMTR